MGDLDKVRRLIKVAKGEAQPDLLLENVHLINVFTGEIYVTNVALMQGTIAGVGTQYRDGKERLDIKGKYLTPGLMDAHVHIESSLLTPAEYARAIIPHGTTSVFIDPHEIANVLGTVGINYILEGSKGIPLDVYVLAPSCVPATDLETSGATITKEDIESFLLKDRVLGLAEVMNFPGVLAGDHGVLGKVMVAKSLGKPIDGHCPGLRNSPLNAYVSTGIESDHETIDKGEAQEKLRAGMWLMIREGSAAKNLKDLLPAITQESHWRCVWATDDLEVKDILSEGHINAILRKALKEGLDIIKAVRMATINTAQRFGLKHVGAVAPGYRADLVIFDDLKDFKPVIVIKDGRVVCKNGEVTAPVRKWVDPNVLNTIRIRPIEIEDFKLKIEGDNARVIGLVPGQIVTKSLVCKVNKDAQGHVLSDVEQDILKIAVIERHKATGNIGLGLVTGLGLKEGAMASSVAHDSHNIVVVGENDLDMLVAVKEIERLQGGFVVANRGNVTASLPLPIAGLISTESAEDVSEALNRVIGAAESQGVSLENPFFALSFLSLPVIPELKITDKGLIDVEQFRMVPLEIS
jgi:adenine deaminase